MLCLFVSGSFCAVFQKYILRHGFRLSLVLNLLLIFHQISVSCCYKIILKEECSDDCHASVIKLSSLDVDIHCQAGHTKQYVPVTCDDMKWNVIKNSLKSAGNNGARRTTLCHL